MDKNAKHVIVSKLKDDMQSVSSVFLCNFNGLTVDKDTQLRRKMRESGSSYSVVKNTLLKLAFEGTDFSKLNDHLVGNTAVATNGEDIVGLAKLIKEFSKENKSFTFKAGVVEGKVIDVNQLETLANLPPKEVLVAKMCYLLNYPIQGLVTALAGLPRNLVVVLDQIKKQQESSKE